jgi:hypothetical protein
MATAPPPARQRFNPREQAAALPWSYTTSGDATHDQPGDHAVERLDLPRSDTAFVIFPAGGQRAEARMARQPGLFDVDERLRRLSDIGDQLEAFAAVVDFEMFRPNLAAALNYSDGTKGGRPPSGPHVQGPRHPGAEQPLGRSGRVPDQRPAVVHAARNEPPAQVIILLESLRGQVSAFFRHPASCPSAVVFSGCRRTIDWHQPHKRSKDGPYSD